jgi:hypothetical protein
MFRKRLNQQIQIFVDNYVDNRPRKSEGANPSQNIVDTCPRNYRPVWGVSTKPSHIVHVNNRRSGTLEQFWPGVERQFRGQRLYPPTHTQDATHSHNYPLLKTETT